MKTLILLLVVGLFGLSACQASGGLLGRTVAELNNPVATLDLFFNT